MKYKGLMIIGFLAVLVFFIIKKKATTSATTIPIPADASTPKQTTVLDFPLADIVRTFINNTIPDVYTAPSVPPEIPGMYETITTFQ